MRPMCRNPPAWPSARAAPTATCSSWFASSWAARAARLPRTVTALARKLTMSEPVHDAVRIGIVSISDRASSGVYEDKGDRKSTRLNSSHSQISYAVFCLKKKKKKKTSHKQETKHQSVE